MQTNKIWPRFKKLAIIYFILLIIACFYLLLINITNFSIPCIIYKITGFKCPGCGITRMLNALIHLDFKEAYNQNMFLFISSPFILFIIIDMNISYLFNKKSNKIVIILEIIYIILLISFGIIRNIYGV